MRKKELNEIKAIILESIKDNPIRMESRLEAYTFNTDQQFKNMYMEIGRLREEIMKLKQRRIQNVKKNK